MPTYGLRPDDLVRDSRGDVAIDLKQTFYATRTDAEMQVNPLGTATSAKDGKWQFTATATGVFGRDPEGNIRFYDSEEPKLTVASASSTYVPQVEAGQTFLAKVENRSGDAVVAVIGDSTGDATDEWFYGMLSSLGAANPKVGIDYRVWSHLTETYAAPTTVQAGSQDGVVFNETFTKTGALIGSAPEVGNLWIGDSGVDSLYTLDGSKITYSGTTTLNAYYAVVPGVPGSRKVEATFRGNTAQSGRQVRLLGSYVSSSNQLRLIHSFGSGLSTWRIEKVIGGTTTTVVSGAQDPIPANNADYTWSASLTWNGTAVSATINGNTINGTITASDVTALTQTNLATGFSFNATISMDDYKVTQTGTGPATMIHAYNGSWAGSNASGGLYDVNHGVLPVAPDLVFISYSHNHGTETPSVYLGAIGALVDKVRALYPAAGIVLTSQNPRVYPAVNQAEHLTRLTALRAYAQTRRYGYAPVVERFNAQASIPALIASDGIHPNSAGSAVWRDAVLAYLKALTPTAT